MTAFVRFAIVVAVQLAAVVLLTRVAAGSDGIPVEQAITKKRSVGGAVLEDPDCGCPINRPAPGSPEATKYPTRCLAGNAVGGGVYLPVNDDGKAYPSYRYPAGYPSGPPYSRAYPAKLKWLTGSAGAGATIPFPGWPAVKGNHTSEWEGGGRPKYTRAYEKLTGKESTPGKLRADAVNRKSGWEEWQIHHILERKHNATDDYGNLVPAYSYPRSWAKAGSPQANLNEHSKYTQYWQRIRVDSQFRGAKHAAIWDEIKDCKVVIWP